MLAIGVLVMAELGLLYADVIVSIGFLTFNNRGVPTTEKLSMPLMCAGDLTSFVISWFKPKVAGVLLAITSGLTLILSLISSNGHSLRALWLTGGLFWLVKFVLSYVFYNKLRLVLSRSGYLE
jgi:hypothetical protein